MWEDASNKVSYGKRREYFQGFELDSVMNYPLKNAIIDFINSRDVSELVKVIREQIDHYPKKVLDALMNMLSTHDTARLITVLSENINLNATKTQMASLRLEGDEYERAKMKLKLATLLQFTLYGVPSIYYGDEIGMQGFSDPLNRQTYPWGDEDLELLAWFCLLGEIRRTHEVFSCGEFREVYAQGGCFVFSRENKSSEILVAVNLDEKNISLDFDGELINLLNKERFANHLILKQYECGIYIKC